MEHIKPPIRVTHHILHDVYHAYDVDGQLVCSLEPGALCTTSDAANRLSDVQRAVNEHAPLVAQRDALVAACEKLVFGERIANEHEDFTLLVEAAEMARAALALVKGEQKGDDADQD